VRSSTREKKGGNTLNEYHVGKKCGGGDREAQELGSLGKDDDIACLSAQLAGAEAESTLGRARGYCPLKGRLLAPMPHLTFPVSQV